MHTRGLSKATPCPHWHVTIRQYATMHHLGVGYCRSSSLQDAPAVVLWLGSQTIFCKYTLLFELCLLHPHLLMCFCSLYNNIKAPSQLQPSATYYLFKDGIEPKWEDPRNANGGSWTCNAPRTPNGKSTLDAWWLHAVSVGNRLLSPQVAASALFGFVAKQHRVACCQSCVCVC